MKYAPGSRLRILQMVDNLAPGGLERVASDLAIAQKAAGHHPQICCIFDPGALAADAVAAGVPVTAFYKKPGLSPGLLLRLLGFLRRNRQDVVHIHNSGIHHYGAVAARLAGVPVVINTRHGVSNSQGAPFRDFYFKRMMPLTSQVVYVNDLSRRFYEEARIVPPSKGRVILNGIQLTPFLEHPATPGGRRPRFCFGTTGRLVPVKGHACLIDAFATIARGLPGAELRIAGGGVLQNQLQEQIERLDLTGRVRLEGSLTDIPAFLRDLDVFVCSSTSEGLPLAILEAMAAGLPIVSTRVGGVPEVALEGEVAWYSPPGDTRALADNLEQAAASEDLERMGARARELATEKYSVRQMHQQYEALFWELLPS